MQKIKVNLPVVLEVPDEVAEEILHGDISALLATIYVPNEERGKWYVQGECNIDGGININVK